MIYKTELDVEYAVESATISQNALTTLNNSDLLKNGDLLKNILFPLLEQVDNVIKHSSNDDQLIIWNLFSFGLQAYASHIECLAAAKSNDINLQTLVIKKDLLVQQFYEFLDSHRDEKWVYRLPESLKNISHKSKTPENIKYILNSIPIPTLYFKSQMRNYDFEALPDDTPPEITPLLKLIVFIDQDPIATPQVLKENLLYNLSFRVKGTQWPRDAEKLRIDMLTTCPKSVFDISEFIFNKPQHILINGDFEAELQGHILFRAIQSTFLNEISFVARAAFENSNGEITEIPVIGHTKLNFKINSNASHPLLGASNKRVDAIIESEILKLIHKFPAINNELPELLDVLNATMRIVTIYAQTAVYKNCRNISESDFQTRILNDLKLLLGSDVIAHPEQAGGITDIYYKGTIIELKVERENGSREFIAQKYTKQAAQYSSSDARQVSILLVLDLTPKINPPSDIRNDILVKHVETHGSKDEFPSIAFVFVINGNTTSPSDYSR